MFSTLIHLGVDAFLISAFLAGVKRSTGLTPALARVPNKDFRQLLRSYLELGEYAFDFAVVIFGIFFVREDTMKEFTSIDSLIE